MKDEKDLISALEEINQKNWKNLYAKIRELDFPVMSAKFETVLSDEQTKEFELNRDIQFVCSVSGDGSGEMEYYYAGTKIDPNSHYILPENYAKVSVLRILQECIAQETYKPDIRQLEIGKEELEERDDELHQPLFR